jgi:hypothetical protein
MKGWFLAWGLGLGGISDRLVPRLVPISIVSTFPGGQVVMRLIDLHVSQELLHGERDCLQGRRSSVAVHP